MPRRYSVAQARQHLSDVLDAAERGELVAIERRGVRFGVVPVARPRRSRRRPLIVWVDPAVRSGQWSWGWDEGGLRFAPRGGSR